MCYRMGFFILGDIMGLLFLFLFIFVGLIVFFSWRYLKSKTLLWTALSAIGTCGAVIVAIYLPIYQEWSNSPRLEIRMPAYTDHFIRWGNEYKGPRRYYSIDVELVNMGNSTADDCQPILAAYGRNINGKWQHESNWAPIGLQWLLTNDEQLDRPYPERRDLPAKSSYIFRLGELWEDRPNLLILARHSIPTGQPDKFLAGEYCFEIKVDSSNTAPVVKYFKINWKDKFTQDETEKFRDEKSFKDNLVIEMLRTAPWE